MVNLVTTNTFTTTAASSDSLPRLTTADGSQRAGTTYTVDPGDLTNVNVYQWKANGSNVADADSSSFVAPATASALVSCVVTGDEGTVETPALINYHDHSDPQHSTVDDDITNLIPHVDATHIAIADADWSSTSTWDVGTVPLAGSVVLIPYGRTVVYDVAATAPRLDRVRVDGTLTWAIDQSTQMLVETLTASLSGQIVIGTSSGRLPLAYTAEIIISDRAYQIDSAAATVLDFANDPQLASRGLMWHGRCSIWAAEITPRLYTEDGGAPMIGDTSITLASTPTNWSIGDVIVIAGTKTRMIDDGAGGSETVTLTEDETRTLTGVSGAVLTWAGGLTYDHDHKNAALKALVAQTLGQWNAMTPTPVLTQVEYQAELDNLQPAIINKTRNVIVRSEAPHEDAVWMRGHTMAVHGPAVTDIWGAAFLDMGRSDKSRAVGAQRASATEGQPDVFAFVALDGSQVQEGVLGATSNVKARYPVHTHQCKYNPTVRNIIRGCYVENAPAWAYVHHEGDIDFMDCVAHNFVGAGFVAESANEIGAWVRLTAIGTRRGFNGDRANRGNPKNAETHGKSGDFAFTGMGMFFRGRGLRVVDCYVGSTPSAYVFFHRANKPNPLWQLSDTRALPREALDTASLSYLGWGDADDGPGDDGHMNIVDLPIRHFAGNRAAGLGGYGFAVTKSGAKANHALAVNVKNLTYWSLSVGTHLEYVARYNFIDCKYFGPGHNPPGNTKGFILTTMQISNTRNMVSGFDQGFNLWGIASGIWSKDFTLPDDPLFAVLAQEEYGNTESIEYTETKGYLNLLDGTSVADVTRISTSPTEIVPTLADQFIAYTWDNTTSNTAVVPGYDYTDSPFIVTDSLGDTRLPMAYDPGGLWHGQADHNTLKVKQTDLDDPQWVIDNPVPTELGHAPWAVNDLYESDAQTTVATGSLLVALGLRDGWYTNGGKNILLFPLYISDRVSGRPALYTVAVEMTGSVPGGWTANGPVTRSATNPVRADIVETCAKNSFKTFNVLAAATGSGGTLVLGTPTSADEMLKPDYGILKNNYDGTMTYTPDPEHVSAGLAPDVMYVPIYDGQLRYHFVKILVTTS